MKQTIEIEVPVGKKAVWENNQIVFVDVEPHWKSIKTFKDALEYCRKSKELSCFTDNFLSCPAFSYEKTVAALRLVVAALTNNERLSLVSGDLYYPVVQLCEKKHINTYLSNNIIGEVKTEGKDYYVISGYGVSDSSYSVSKCTENFGYINLYKDNNFSSTNVGYLKVSSIEIAEHLSTYFGKLVFEAMYGGSNYDWIWIEKDKK